MPAEETASPDTPRVAVIYEVPPPKDYLQDALREAHIPVAAEYRAGDLDDLDVAGIDVVLVTLDEAMEPFLERVTDFVAETSVPVVFEESEVSRHLVGWDRNRWLRHLRAKLVGSSDTRPPLPRDAANDRPGTGAREGRTNTEPPVWVLGASIGGPESVRRFLEALPADVPAAFILVQHMGAEFQQVLADRLARVTDLEVLCAEDGQSLTPGRVIVAPVDRRLTFEENGTLRLEATGGSSAHEPSMDDVMLEASKAFGGRLGAIIFSGQARDAVAGCGLIHERGGSVWTQDAASSSVSTIADGIREAGYSTYEGSPEQLAAHLLETARQGSTITEQAQE